MSQFSHLYIFYSLMLLDAPLATDGPPMASSSTDPDISDYSSQAVKYLDMIMATGATDKLKTSTSTYS